MLNTTFTFSSGLVPIEVDEYVPENEEKMTTRQYRVSEMVQKGTKWKEEDIICGCS